MATKAVVPNKEFEFPQAEESELSILSTGLHDPPIFRTIAEKLEPEHFYTKKNQDIMRAVFELLSDGVELDMSSIVSRLKDMGCMGNGMGAYIGKVMDRPVAADIDHHSRLIIEAATKRKMAIGANNLLNGIKNASGICELEKLTSTTFGHIKMALQDVPGKKLHSFNACTLLKKDFPDPKWAIPSLLVDGLTLLVGKPKQGKSMLALNIALSIAYGGKALSSIDVESGTVIYLALEDPWRRLKSRIEQMIGGAEPPENLILFNEWPRMDAGGLKQLEKEISQHKDIRLIIIDTLQKIKGPNNNRSTIYENDYQQLSDLKLIADRAGVAMLVVHHLRKMQSEDIFDQVSGSLGITGAADSTLVLERKTGQADAVLHVTGRDVESAEYALEFDPKYLGWTLLGDAREVKNTEQHQTVFNCIKEYGHPISPKEIMGITDIQERYLYKILNILRKDGSIKKVGRANYISLK